MNTTLAHNYYVKALDNYPYCLPDFLEAMDYALSYDPHNADINSLMGKFYMEQLRKYDVAKDFFEVALANDVHHIPTYFAFISWCIHTKEVALGQRLIRFAWTIPGINQPMLLHREALLAELNGQFRLAHSLLKKAEKMTLLNSTITFLKEERNRVKGKMTKRKK